MPDFPSDLIQALRDAERVVGLTGSGISTESGVPTFREAQTGFLERYNPQEFATPEAFARDPRLAWEWYEWRRKLVVEATPTPGHEALAHLERRIPDFTLVTQNSRRPAHKGEQPDVVELHGNILRSKCSLEGEVAEPEEYDDCVPPRCPRCGGFLRPEVAWFGEMMPPGAPEAASEAARGCELFFLDRHLKPRLYRRRVAL